MPRHSSLALPITFVVLLLVLATSLGQAATAPPDGRETTVLVPAAEPPIGKDTYVASLSPATNFGSGSELIVRYESLAAVARSETLLYFDVAPYVPAGATITGATLRLYQTGSSGGTTWAIQPLAITSAWGETAVTWSSKPSVTTTNDPSASLDVATGWKQWDVKDAVNLWYTGKLRNDGLLLRGDEQVLARRTFSSREGQNPPQLSVTYVEEGTPTATPTATLTPTRTPTRTPSPVPTADLIADRLEVTQAVQDFNHSVRLVADKRTFVRFHVRSASGNYPTFATLTAQRAGSIRVLFPLNVGGVTVRPSPDRAVLNHAFLFELPDGFREGTVSLTANLNPLIGTFRDYYDPQETNYANNSATRTVTFETVPSVPVVIYRVGYLLDGTLRYPGLSERGMLVNWLERAYPLSDLDVWRRTVYYGAGSVIHYTDYDSLTTPNCGDVNTLLFNKKVWDLVSSSGVPWNAHYYGMVSDKGGFMRGCAADIPSWTAAGPTGSGNWGWDYDGSYGDWYGGHELGHTYGRFHAEFCGAGGGAAYPYPNGNISPSQSGNTALYGFDSSGPTVYPPSWKDLMTYCDNEWMSDFTYEGLMNFFQTNAGAAASGVVPAVTMDRLLVAGTIDPATQAVNLRTLFVIPQAEEARPRVPGDYAIVLRDKDNNLLARYPFTPITLFLGPDLPSPEPTPVPAQNPLLINEMVPYMAGTTKVEIEGPGGGVLATVIAGAKPPVVSLTSPNGGEVLSASTVTVAWAASDPDAGDTLRFDVQYSRDGGASWEMLAQEVEGSSVVLDAANVGSTTQGLFRVWASDGIHTAFDVSDRTFTVPNRVPEIEILGPPSGSLFLVNQTVPLEASAYDVDTGSMEPSQLTWTSDLDGLLGNGETLPFAGLSVGLHTITFRADDGQGGVAQASIAVEVTDDLSLFDWTEVYLPQVVR